MSKENEYHGAEYVEGKELENVPSIPESQESTERAPIGNFSVVRFKGNYGFLCGGFQEFERYNISFSEVKQIRWSFFGICPSSITCLDENRNVVYQEGFRDS